MPAAAAPTYEISGSIAKKRIAPLLPSDWREHNNSNDNNDNSHPTFLWENAPRRDTKAYRDTVQAYSHLPNGSSILDSKWVLGRLLTKEQDSDESESSNLLATLETHCFRGLDGFAAFWKKQQQVANLNHHQQQQQEEDDNCEFPDLLRNHNKKNENNTAFPEAPRNLWVVKDAQSNGAGGIWVVGPENAAFFFPQEEQQSSSSSPLYPEHAYVAQRYTWPPVLYGGRKCHVRVYGLLTSDGRAFVHQRAFLHVANDPFEYRSSSSSSKKKSEDSCKTKTPEDKEEEGAEQTASSFEFVDSVHITNCCANSDDESKFAGEILADLRATEHSEINGQPVIPLGRFYPSICASVSTLAGKSFPFLQGGQANNGFEYLGMDFILSVDETTGEDIAYMLEVNAPPSQDTATGLPHAEDVHDTVLRDLLHLWVLPKAQPQIYSEVLGGWSCVYEEPQSSSPADHDDAKSKEEQLIVPSKAAILNKIRWTLFEKKMSKLDSAAQNSNKNENDRTNKGTIHCLNHHCGSSSALSAESQDKEKVLSPIDAACVQSFARSKFPYFSSNTATTASSFSTASTTQTVFFENAGGSQVPQSVIDCVTVSLSCRHRDRIGSKSKTNARKILSTLLGVSEQQQQHATAMMFLGPNATSLLSTLAQIYVKYGLLQGGDQVILSIENHRANTDPWVLAAQQVGASIIWWTPWKCDIQDLMTDKTRVVALTHASNLLGHVRDIRTTSEQIKSLSGGRAHVVVDGVAATAHCFADLDSLQHSVDWYVVSCHKMFGPHIGGLYANRRSGAAITQLVNATDARNDDDLYKLFEIGTQSYEAAAGLAGLGVYFRQLSTCSNESSSTCSCATVRRDVHLPQIRSSQQELSEPTTEMPSMNLTDSSFMLEVDLNVAQTRHAYDHIQTSESSLVELLLNRFERSPKVRILNGGSEWPSVVRLPVISFVHDEICSSRILQACEENHICCRKSSFLCTTQLAEELDFNIDDGVLRISLAHYNIPEEIDHLFDTLERLDGWY